MVNREQLQIRGLRAYELGRLRTAVRVAAYLVPLALCCALETGAREPCACLGVLLLAGSVWLRWRNRRGVESVTTGLLAGSIPLFAGLVVARVAPAWGSAPAFSGCAALCFAAGGAAGSWLGVRTARSRAGFMGWATAACIALLAASLGCIGLGVPGVVGASVGLLLGGAGASLITQRAMSGRKNGAQE